MISMIAFPVTMKIGNDIAHARGHVILRQGHAVDADDAVLDDDLIPLKTDDPLDAGILVVVGVVADDHVPPLHRLYDVAQLLHRHVVPLQEGVLHGGPLHPHGLEEHRPDGEGQHHHEQERDKVFQYIPIPAALQMLVPTGHQLK